MNLPKGKHFGLIAHEVEEVLLELVNATEFDRRMIQIPEVPKPGTRQTVQTIKQSSEKIDYKTVNYTELIPIMVKAMQE